MIKRPLKSRPSILGASVATLIAALVLGSSSPVFAGSATWGTTPSSGNWVAGAGETNWSSGLANFVGGLTGNGSTDTATFNAASTITSITINSSVLNVGNITFSGAAVAYTIGATNGNALLLTSGGTIQTSGTSNVETINAPLVIEGGGYTISSNAASATNVLNINGGITGGVAVGSVLGLSGSNTGSNLINGVIADGVSTGMGVTKTGAGTWVLTGADTYSGVTSVNGGTLQIGNGSTGNLTGTSGVAVANGATLAINLGAGATFTPGIALNGPGAVLNTVETGTNTLSGVISGTGVLNQASSGTTILTNTDNYSGATNVTAGTLQIGDGSNGNLTATSGVTVAAGATLATDLSSGASFSAGVDLVGTNSALNAIQSGTNTLSGVISGSGVLNVTGGGNTILTNTESYTGATNVTTGTLTVNGSTALASTVNVATAGILAGTGTINGNATLTGNGVISFGTGGNIVGTLGVTGGNWNGVGTVTSLVTVSSGNFNIGSGANLTASAGVNVTGGTISATDGTAKLTGSLNYTSSSNSTFQGVIAGASSVTMNNGSATLTLSGANTYSGTTTITAGTLQIGDGTTAGATIATSGTVQVNGSGVLATDLKTGETFGNAVSLNATTASLNAIQSGTNTLSGVISGSGVLNVSGGGNTILTNTETYTGATNVTNGTLTVNGSTAALSTVAVGMAGTLGGTGTINGNATLTGGGIISFGTGGNIAGTLGITGGNWNGVGTVTGAVTSSSGALSIGSGANLTATAGLNVTGGTISAADGTAKLTGSLDYTSSSNSTFQGVIAGGSAVTMNSVGQTLTLSGVNTYTGTTTITAGTLQIGDGTTAGATIAPSGTVQVNGGGVLATNLKTGETFGNAVSLNTAFTSLNAVQSGTNTLSGVISGSGVLNVSGGGNTILTNTESYAGATNVTNGTLTVNGSTAALSTVNVGTAGTLAGTGTILGNATLTGAGIIDFGTGGVIAGTLNVTGGGNWNGTGSVAGLVTVTSGNFEIGAGASLTAFGGVLVTGGTILKGSSTSVLTVLTGSLEYTSTSTSTFQGVITGGNIVDMHSPGVTLTLSGVDTYTGSTTVTAGTLQVGDGTTGNLTATSGVAVANGGTLATNLATGATFTPAITLNGLSAALNAVQTGTNTLTGVISGSGVLNQNGAGTTILTNNESYTGATTVTAGTLQVGNGATGNLMATTGVTVASGGTLATNLASGATFTPAIALNGAGAALNAIQSGTNTLSGVISGSGVLNQNGAGTTILNNLESYTGATTVNGGILQIGDGTKGNLTSTSGVTVANNAALVTNLGGVATFTPAIALNGSNSALNAIQTGTTTFSGVISGSGNFNQNGTGTTILAANNTYTGTTNINAGILEVNGSIASQNTYLNPGAQLQGMGVIGGNLINNGMLKPGDSPGTLTINGNYAQTSAGNLRVQIGSPSSFDQLNITGTATLGGSLTAVSMNGFKTSYIGQTFQFLTAAGGVSGTFSNFNNQVGSVGILVKLYVTYGPTSASLVASQVPPSVPIAGLPGITVNDFSTAGFLDGIVKSPGAGRILAVLDSDNLNQLIKDVQLINPDQLVNLGNVSSSVSKIHTLNLQGRMEALQSGAAGFSALGLHVTDNSDDVSAGYAGSAGPDGKEAKGGKEVSPPPADNRWGSFVTGAGEFDHVGDTTTARGFHLDSGGITIGVDYRFTDHFVAGIFGGYTDTGISIADGGHIDVNAGKVGLYGTYFDGGFYVNAAVQGGYDSYDANRASLGGMAHSSPTGGDVNFLIAPGYNWTSGGLTFGPITRFQYSYESTGKFTETGSLTPMSVSSQHTDSVISAVGVKASYDWKVAGVTVRPEVRLEWEHEYGDVVTSVASQLADGTGGPFTVKSPAIGRDSMHVGAGFSVIFSERVNAYAYYDGELFRTNYDSSTVSGGVRISF